MSNFGWSLPPGCGTLPGEEPEYPTNQHLKEAFPEHDSIGEITRACAAWSSR